MGNYYMQTVPNSHAYGSLRNFTISFEYHAHRTEELTPEHILIGLKNTIKRGSSLEQLTFPDGAQGPCFITIQDMIEYVQSNEWNLKDFIIRIKNTLKNGYDLKNERKMERSDVYRCLDTERDYQDLRWTPRREKNDTPDAEKPPAEWINYIEYHLTQAKNGVYMLNEKEALAQVRKVAALAVRCLELHGCPERVIPEELLDNE